MAVQPQTSALTEAAQVARANESSKQPVVFIHGLWLLAGCWDRWAEHFEEAGYVAVLPGWPDDPPSVADANRHPEAFAGKGIRVVVDHFEDVIRGLKRKPAVIGHSLGGLLTQLIAGRGLAAASVAVDPGPFRGVLPVPYSALKATSPALRNPGNFNRAVSLTFEQFRYGFANAVDESEAKELFATFAVPAPAKPLFQAAFANLNPRTEARVDTRNPARGPLLLMSGARDNTVPPAMVEAAFRLQKRNEGVTEFVSVAGRGHSLPIDSGWREVAEIALAFVKRFAG